jgi:hypothetical protein
MGLWNNVARFQDGSLKLQKVGKLDTREALHAAAKLRIEELLDGFMHGFTGGDRQIDVPPALAISLPGSRRASSCSPRRATRSVSRQAPRTLAYSPSSARFFPKSIVRCTPTSTRLRSR